MAKDQNPVHPSEPPQGVPTPTTPDEGRTRRSGVRFTHVPHPHIARRKEEGPIKVADQLPKHNAIVRLNSRLALLITIGVGSMWCAYLFILLALVSFPAALQTGDKIIIVAWISQTFFQLVLLPIIIVGQNIQSEAADKRADQTYKDAEAVLQEALQIQQHLSEQDQHLLSQQQCLNHIVATLTEAYPAVAAKLPPLASQ
jgi:hypothetical protein